MDQPMTVRPEATAPVTPTPSAPEDADSENDARRRPSQDAGGPKNGWRMAIEWALLIAGALLIAILIKTFLFQAFYIPSESMTPTLEVGDRVLVNKVSYDLHDVHRGDIIVFKNPEADGEVSDLVKRVIALPGETIETIDGVVFIDGVALDEPYLPDGTTTCINGTGQNDQPCEDVLQEVVPDGEVFVMGDNRGSSKDSRVFHAVDESRIVGRVFVRIWPVTHLGFL